MYCRYCGNELKGGARFCSKCGKPVSSTAVQNAKNMQPAKPKIPQIKYSAKCSLCGAWTLRNFDTPDLAAQDLQSISWGCDQYNHVPQVQQIELYS